jgi:hypothetical protein
MNHLSHYIYILIILVSFFICLYFVKKSCTQESCTDNTYVCKNNGKQSCECAYGYKGKHCELHQNTNI